MTSRVQITDSRYPTATIFPNVVFIEGCYQPKTLLRLCQNTVVNLFDQFDKEGRKIGREIVRNNKQWKKANPTIKLAEETKYKAIMKLVHKELSEMVEEYEDEVVYWSFWTIKSLHRNWFGFWEYQ